MSAHSKLVQDVLVAHLFFFHRNASKKGVQWDEDNLLYNESQRHLYGTMKIDDPPTPFHYEGDFPGESELKELFVNPKDPNQIDL